MMRFLVGAMFCSASLVLWAQKPAQPLAVGNEKPLPDIVAMMQKVISDERESETMQSDYLVREWLSSWDGSGQTWSHGSSWRSTDGEDRESEVFWLQGVRVSRLVRVATTRGLSHTYDHTLTSDELGQENSRIDAELAQVTKARVLGDIDGERKAGGALDEIRMSRLLELGTFSNPRWGKEDSKGRGRIVVDYKGGPCSGACTPLDGAARYITGTLTIDEEDLAVAEFEGVFTDAWTEPGKGGWKVLKGSTLTYWGGRQKNGTWFPLLRSITTTVRHGSSYRTHAVSLFDRDYRKFRVTSTILPEITFLPQDAVHEAPPRIPMSR